VQGTQRVEGDGVTDASQEKAFVISRRSDRPNVGVEAAWAEAASGLDLEVKRPLGVGRPEKEMARGTTDRTGDSREEVALERPGSNVSLDLWLIWGRNGGPHISIHPDLFATPISNLPHF
jgi:hypothetical protein